VAAGTDSRFLESLVVVDSNNAARTSAVSVGNISQKYICVPDIDSLLVPWTMVFTPLHNQDTLPCTIDVRTPNIGVAHSKFKKLDWTLFAFQRPVAFLSSYWFLSTLFIFIPSILAVMLALAISGLILITVFTYIYQLIDRFETGASAVDPELPYFKQSNILLVTAHPDDECMFFGPVLMNLTAKSLKNKVHVLCLSKGTWILRYLWSPFTLKLCE
jgi:hypothetical protein